MEYGSTVLYHKYVTKPSLDINTMSDELFKTAGFDVCVGSTDATHVPLLDCPAWATVIHKVECACKNV